MFGRAPATTVTAPPPGWELRPIVKAKEPLPVRFRNGVVLLVARVVVVLASTILFLLAFLASTVAGHVSRDPAAPFLPYIVLAFAVVAMWSNAKETAVGVGFVAAAAVTGARRWPRGAILAGAVGWFLVAPWMPWWSGFAPVMAAAAWALWDWTHRPVPVPAPYVPDERVAEWRTVIADPFGDTPFLAGSTVEDAVEDVVADGEVVGFRLAITGRDAEQHAGVVESAAPKIAAVYATVPAGITVHGVGDHRRCIVEVVKSSHLEKRAADRKERLLTPKVMTEPLFDVSTGVVTVGTLADDGAPMTWTLFVPGAGARHGWIPGSTRGGKSVSVSGLLGSACSRGIVVPHILDLQGGVSLPEWQGLAASWATDVPSAIVALRRLEKLMDWRTEYMASNRLRVLDPSPEHPLHLVVIDEAPELAKSPTGMLIIDRLCRLAAKCGIPIVWISQMGNATKAFGDAGTPMREQLKAGNVWAHYLSGESVGQVLSGAMGPTGKAFDPSSVVVPKDVPGASVIWGPKHPVPLLGRALWLKDPDTSVPGWVDIPAFEWPVEDAPEATPVPDAGPLSPEDLTSRDRVKNALKMTPVGEQLTTGDVMRVLPDMPKRTLQDALRRLADQRDTITDGGYGKWVRA